MRFTTGAPQSRKVARHFAAPLLRFAREEKPMSSHHLPCGTWLVIEPGALDGGPLLVSQHASCGEAEAERDRRNRNASEPHFQACMVLEPIAQRMGGRQSPAAQRR
jgi:hypothetical protein